MLDSKVADTNNYFADPIAKATADVIDSLADPEKPGKLIQLQGEYSSFEYVNPPQSSATREDEKADLNKSILFDSFTPDFSLENMKGLGTLSGEAIKRAMILGYIKRENLLEIYEELVDREKNIIIEILKLLHPEKVKELTDLKIKFQFAEPFKEDNAAQWNNIAQLFSNGVISLETAVERIGITDKPEEEIQRIKQGKEQTAIEE